MMASCGSIATAISLSRIPRDIFPYSLSLSGNSRPPLYYGLILPCPFLPTPRPWLPSSPLHMPYVCPCARYSLAGFQSSTSDKCQARLSLVVRQLLAAK